MQGYADMRCVAFAGSRRVAQGVLREVAGKVWELLVIAPEAQVLIFDEASSMPVEVDFRGTQDDVLARLAPATVSTPDATGKHDTTELEAGRGPGRPKLGVVAREVTLLPRHWEWLNAQRGGASVALRQLVEAARRADAGAAARRAAQDAAYRFMVVMAGDAPGFEEAVRSLYAGDLARLHGVADAWPADVRSHALWLAQRALGDYAPASETADATRVQIPLTSTS